MTGPGQARGRLEDLYEISKLFATFETVEQTFAPVLDIVTRTLPLRSAILMEAEGRRSKMNVWPSEGRDSEPMRAAKEHAEAAYAYLVGAASTKPLGPDEPAAMTTQPPQAGTGGDVAKRFFIVIPLVVARRQPFGAVQVEGTQPFDEMDLIFVNAIANQLAITLDRDRAWRHDITRRENAEAGRTDAEARSATSERERIIAESSSDRYEALASDNARLYEQAQRAVGTREQILTIVSHDLRNPLGNILMATALLAKSGAPEEQRPGIAQAVGRIERAARRIQRLIDDLLDFASIEAGQLAIKREPQDAGSMIHETLASFESVAPEKRLQWTAKVEPHLPNVYCDRDRILQVLSNLVANATKATAEGGHITLRVEAHGPDLLFAVADDGSGISEADVKHLFERYWRGDDPQYAGTGLGLSIARGIVSAHGGRIWAESELGRGATFLFTVPAAS
jgi:signal transduction histidine kinase